MGIFDNQQVGVAFCSPHRAITLPSGERILDTVTVQWHRKRMGMALGTNINFIELFEDGKEIGEARTSAAYRCLNHNPQPKYLMFLDDDVLVEQDAFTKLLFRLQTNPEFDIAAGVYCCKFLNPSDPLIYAGDGCGAFWDWTLGDLLTTKSHGITGSHMGLTLIRVSFFQRMLDAGVVDDDTPFFKTIRETSKSKSGANQTRSGTEDLWFYQLARKLDPPVNIVVDTSVLAGHIDKHRGITWGLPMDSPPVVRAKWYADRDREEAGQNCECHITLPDATGVTVKPDPDCTKCKGTGKIPLKLALDMGAGGRKREWKGYKTYTTDLRPDTNPDYCQDSRWLNFPEGHWDLVASSHHLEHLGRWDQEKVWKEIFRITRPGGKIEHIVPSVEWAAEKIHLGQVDESVMDVLYGAQEGHGYKRELNLHFFGYTKEIARALAEGAGFINVKVQDWRSNEELYYNLVITGDKPAEEGAPAEVSSGEESVGEDRIQMLLADDPSNGEVDVTVALGNGKRKQTRKSRAGRKK